LLTDVDLDGKADPGDTLKYTVQIGSSGQDATGVTFTDTVDPNTTFVGGSLAASPVATNDTFPVTVTGNVRINSANLASPFSVVANDFLGLNPLSTISTVQAVNTIVTNTITATSANGGDIVMTVSGADMGKFTYNPPAGFEGTDTFTYTLTDNTNVTTAAANRTATVSITVSGMIWFINNNAAACTTLAAGCGRLTNPFSTLGAFAGLNNGAGNNPAANDNILFTKRDGLRWTSDPPQWPEIYRTRCDRNLSAIAGITPATGSDPLPAQVPVLRSSTSRAPASELPSVKTTPCVDSPVVIQRRYYRHHLRTLNVSDVTLNATAIR
jgi:uncharacterized repeat protein (TIGR01451 family)